MRFARTISTQLSRTPIALAVIAVLAALLLLPGLGSFGIWEPQERQLADRAAPRKEIQDKRDADLAKLPPPKDPCLKQAPPDAVARSLQNRAPAMGRDVFGDSDGARRLPLALLGLLTVVALATTASRMGNARAGLIAGLVLLSFPLLSLQSRQLTSEIGTACGGALIVLGLIEGNPLWGLAALVGVPLAFLGGGALLGLVPPLAAIAFCGDRPWRGRMPHWRMVIALIGFAVAIGWVGYQIYDLREPWPGLTPPARSIANHVVAPNGCWSTALGAIWRPDDDLRFIFDSTFEQIAYGTYPWGLLGPIAMIALLFSDDPRKKKVGGVSLAWAGAAYLVTAVFQRKVGFTLWAGFPALALAVGVWLDDLLARKVTRASQMLIGLYFALGAISLGKDFQGFAERATSILVGSGEVAYPQQAHLLLLPTKLWLLVLGGMIGIALAFALCAGEKLAKWSARAVAVAFAATVAIAAFWPLVWQPRMAVHLSTKAMFEQIEELRKPGDQVVLMGDLGDAPNDYTHDFEQVANRDLIVQSIKRPNRVFALAPQSEICALHREIGGAPYFVLDDRNARELLLSNRIDGAVDRNPLREMIQHAEPKDIKYRPKGRIVFDNKIQLLGWDMPKTVGRGDKFTVRMYYKVIAAVGGQWQVLMHFDGASRLTNGDHKPIDDRCPTSTWQPGDFIVDQFTVTAGNSTNPKGDYDVFTGFFTGSNPNWKNMPISEAPGDLRESATDRVKLTQITVD